MSATSRCLDSQPVAGMEVARRLRRQLLAVDEVLTPRARLATIGARRRMAAALGDQRVAHLGERLELAHHAVAAARAPRAARAAAQRVLDRAQRELQLERLDRRVERVRHRHVHGARAVRVGARALAAAERLVVGEVVVAEREVVHRALAERAAERGQHEVGHARRGLDVAGRHRRGRPRVEQAALGGDHRQRAVGALAGRHVGVGEHAQGEVAGRQGHGERAVEVAVVLRGRAREVERRSSRPRRAPRAAARGPPRPPRARRSRSRSPSGELGDARAGAALGVVERLLESGAEACRARSARSAPRPARRLRGRRRAGRAGRPRAGAGCACGPRARAGCRSSSRVGGITTPSSSSERESAGMLPGSRAPTSAWWARLAANPIAARPRDERAG